MNLSRPKMYWSVLLAFLPASVGLAAKVEYNRDVRPILSDKCFHCHGPDPATREADLRLDIREEALKAKAFIPGKPDQSEAIIRIHEKDPDEVMPPPKSPRQLTDADRETLRQWIEQGAEYQPHWSFTPLPESVSVPETKPPGRAKNEIDRFVAAKLEKESLPPAPAATPERWLRRTAFDLTGLPPSRGDLDSFLTDKSSDAREKAVDRLLASPRYGEKMAVDWLDVARYADSFGYQSDIETHAWPYRDWVIDAFNKNLPWDQFITWQLAGDLLPNPTREQLVATAFNRIHRKTQEGGSVEAEFRQEGISDRVHTVGSAFLALTFECTRCHDHKYDPLTMRDYYSMGAFFNSIDEWGLLHGKAAIQPNPVLFLTTPDQDKTIAEQKAAIASAEQAIPVKMKERESAFQAWLASPVAEMTDLSGSFDLDQKDKEEFANAVDPKRPAKTKEANKLVPGKRGQALSFTGDDPLQLGNHGVTNQEDAFSVAFWLKPGEITKRSLVFHNSSGADPGYNGFELLLEDGKLRWMVAREWPGNCIAVRSNQVLASNEWTHVVVSYDGSSKAAGLKISLNGSEVPLEVVRDQLTRNCGSASAFTFGERFRDSGLRGGAVDDIRIFTRPVTALEITSLSQGKPLAELLAATSRDENGLASLRGYYFSAIDPEIRTATAGLKKLRQALTQTIDGVQELPVMKEMAEARPAKILARGEYSHPEGDPLPRVTPGFLPPLSKDHPVNRLGLAQWLTEPNHPLTARVQVNRVWQHFFGRGLVSTSENFGAQGETPSHPELLDWLARDFIAHGWDTKRLCRQIVLSATYSQDSKASPDLRQKDPANILLARGPAKRLPGEDLRDQALALSGLLQPTVGGPPAKPYLPESAFWKVLNSFLPDYKRDEAPGIYRRSLYTFWRRTAPPPGMLAFDVPGRDVCTVRRQQTNTPLQPLVMLNDPQFVEASRGLAIRMMKEGGTDFPSRARWVFREIVGREATTAESQLLAELHESQLEVFSKDPKQAESFLKVGDLTAPPEFPAIDLAAATVVANAILNLDEAITLR
jgi:mono/diheme cytochrome c family protein